VFLLAQSQVSGVSERSAGIREMQRLLDRAEGVSDWASAYARNAEERQAFLQALERYRKSLVEFRPDGLLQEIAFPHLYSFSQSAAALSQSAVDPADRIGMAQRLGMFRSGVLIPALQAALDREVMAESLSAERGRLFSLLVLAAGLLALAWLALINLRTTAAPQLKAREEDRKPENLDHRLHEHIHDVLVSMDQGIVAWDADCIVEIYNQRVIELLDLPEGFMHAGLSLEEQIEHARVRGDYGAASDDDIAAIIQQHRNRIERTVDRVLANGRAIRVNIRRRDGGGMVATYTDITELCKQTERVRRQKAVVETILENLDQGVSLMDGDLNIVAFNKRYLELFDIPEDVVKPGDPLRKFCEIYADLGHYGEGDREEQVQKRIEQAKLFRQETFRRHLANGRSVHIHKAPLPSGGVVTTYGDITERLRYEKDLEVARDKAESASRSKSEFLANMSHEIRTPMNGVLGMAELLADTRLSDQQKNYVEIISESGSALLTIINDILDFSKIEAGKLELDPRTFNLRSAMEDVAILMSTRAAEKQLELIVRFNPDIPEFVVGDAGRIRQIVTNLVGNAVKFTKAGYVLVDVDGTLNGDRVQLKISIEDTGIGLASGELGRVFDKFEQVDSTTTRQYGGTGLGLAISKQLVELMGGEIGAVSQLNHGSTFWFSIELPVDLNRSERSSERANLSGLKVLIVDDIEVNRRILSEQTESWGMIAKVTDSALAALDELTRSQEQGQPYDAVILDYHMPEIDGEELVRRIKAEPGLRDIALIMLSSVDGKGDARRFRQIGVAATLVKPARSSLLFDTIANVMSHSLTGKPVPALDVQQSAPLGGEDDKGKADFNVLLVEDNEINRFVVMRMLDDSAYALTIATNGKEAVDVFETTDIDLILMDVSMPLMDGYEATGVIRQIERGGGLRRTPIVGLTAHTMTGDRERCLEAGMDDYLSKPVQQVDLRGTLDKWLKQEARRRVGRNG
jgi:signal transduction histidine kinase/CheY-like chemotaxis protein